jgi:PAS domain S-box-containing protein
MRFTEPHPIDHTSVVAPRRTRRPARGAHRALLAQWASSTPIADASLPTAAPTTSSDASLAAFIDAMPDAIVLTDRAGRIQLVNRQTEGMFQYARAELVGLPVEVLLPRRQHAIHARHRARFVAHPRPRPMGSGLSLFGRRRDGTEFPVAVSLNVYHAAAGEYVVSAVRDVTALRHSQQALVDAERNRIARDLHDAVTQSLFSASMIAEALPGVWARNPNDAARGMEELRRLTRGALAEMRTLLVELRPAGLLEKPLGTLIAQLAEATSTTTQRPIVVETQDDGGVVAPTVQVALYRIVQEALNNVEKHSGARQVHIVLRHRRGAIALRLEDDGVGFDRHAAAAPPSTGGHLGVPIMRERAKSIGATLALRSQPGKGTTLSVHVPHAWQEAIP